jgi:ATP-dependent exoDNAse (exonuclease V) alpha subunit
MAIFYLRISSVSRGAGRRATAAAAYRAGERIRDERSGELHNYSRRRDVLHTEIFLPQQYAAAAIAWAGSRETLWNTAEHSEKRHNARVAREFQVSIPAELAPLERVALARTFAQELSERYRVAVDLAVHAPRPEGDPRNFHAHLLATTREVTPSGLGARAGLDMAARERRQRQLPDHRQEFLQVRERWASLTNEALRAANISARIDHRSLADQGADREPRPAIPIMHLKMEQRGVRSEYAERLRAQYRERVASREARAAPPAPAKEPAVAQPDLAQIRREAREAWLRLRAQEAAGTRAAAAQEAEPRAPEPEDGFAR